MPDFDGLVAAARRDDLPAIVREARQLLSDAAQDPKLLPLNAHPVGFAHAKIAESNGLTVRLHLWPVPPIDPQDPPWLVHRHAWPLTSYVVGGSVTNELFSVSGNDRGNRLLYEVGYDEGESVMTATSIRVECVRSSVDKIDEGHRYTVPYDAFHCTFGSDTGPTATIAVTGTPSKASPLVVGTPTIQSEYRFKRRVLSLEMAQTIFESVSS